MSDGIELKQTPFNDLLPKSISNDPKIQAASKALDVLFNQVHQAKNKIPYLDYIDLLDEPFLSNLAVQFSLHHEQVWLLAESLDAKRELIKNAINIHRYKGTPWAIREIIRLLGFGEVKIIEGQKLSYNAEGIHDGLYVHGAENSWAIYQVILERPITNGQAINLKKAIIQMAPVRSELLSLNYSEVPLRYNSEANYDGNYNHGEYINGKSTS